jgi:hypothetical protein
MALQYLCEKTRQAESLKNQHSTMQQRVILFKMERRKQSGKTVLENSKAE